MSHTSARISIRREGLVTPARAACLGAALLVGFPGMLRSADKQSVFVERFEGGPGRRWTIESGTEAACLRWHGRGQEGGLHFRSVAVAEYMKSRGQAWAQWDIGTQPFELCWDVHLERALEQNWFYPGVAVAMTSAPPGRMKAEDITVSIGVHMGGLAASVRRGGFYDLQTEGRGAYVSFRDRDLSRLLLAGSGGTASVRWPMKRPDGSRLRFRIRRTKDNRLEFTVLWPGLPGERGKPYWRGEWQMPPEVAGVPLRYVAVRRMPVTRVHLSYPSFVMQGAVTSIQGRLLDASPAPQIERLVPTQSVLTGGARVTLHGRDFADGCRVRVGGKQAVSVSVPSARELLVTLPELPAGQRHALVAVNPNGLAGELTGGVPYGRMIESVRPREALPRGGDIVTVLGAGFGKGTTFCLGDKAAGVLEVIDPFHARVRVPAGQVGRAAVTARTGSASFTGRPLFGYAPHPYLFFTAAELPRLRARFDLPMLRHYRKRVLAEADKALGGALSEDFNASVGATTVLSVAYALTQKQAYKAKLMEWIRRGLLATRYSGFHLMSVSGMAVAYDILYPELAPEDRAAFQDYLDRMLAGYLKNADGSWFLGGSFNFSNTVPVGNCGGMLAGLALMHSTPAAAAAVDIAARKARLYPERCISPSGGCREGIQYWDYGCSFHLMLAHALKNATGDDRGLLDHPHLRANVNFLRTQLGGHGGMFSFCDAREPWLDGFAVCADLGSRYHQPLMLWVADRAAEGGPKVRARGLWAPFAFLWRGTQAGPKQFPGVPTLAWLEDMQWGAMRSDGSFQPRLVVGVKGSRGPLTHHKQKDLGSFVVHAHGEAYLIDPGYYEPKATDHTLPLIDGEGPGVTGSVIDDAWQAGPWRSMTLDSTEGYGKAARRVRRVLVLHGADAVVVLDDIIPADGRPGEVTAQYQTAWKPEVRPENRAAALLTGQKGQMSLRCFGHAVQFVAADRKFSKKGWHWEKVGASGPGDWHSLTGRYTADPARPLVTVLAPRTGGRKEPRATVAYGDGTVVVTLADHLCFRFARKDRRWVFIRLG